jgi:hypothetical protein
MSDGAKAPEFNKVSVLRDLAALSEAARGFSTLAHAEVAAIIKNLTLLESDPTLFAALQRRSFIEKGLELIDGPECPLCDTEWDSEQHLLGHLQTKLAKSAEALKVQQDLLKNGAAVAQSIVPVVSLLAPVQKLAFSHDEPEYSQLLLSWKTGLDDLRSKLASVDGLLGLKSRLSGEWLGRSNGLAGWAAEAHLENRGEARSKCDTRRTDIPDHCTGPARRLSGGDAKESGCQDRVRKRGGGLQCVLHGNG